MHAQEAVVPMAFLRAKPIGVMQMIDQGEQDDKARPSPVPRRRLQCGSADDEPDPANSKRNEDSEQQLILRAHGMSRFVPAMQVIAVHADDPEFKGFDDIAQLPKHRLAEIRR